MPGTVRGSVQVRQRAAGRRLGQPHPSSTGTCLAAKKAETFAGSAAAAVKTKRSPGWKIVPSSSGRDWTCDDELLVDLRHAEVDRRTHLRPVAPQHAEVLSPRVVDVDRRAVVQRGVLLEDPAEAVVPRKVREEPVRRASPTRSPTSARCWERMLSCVSTTPFSAPLVPEVKFSRQGSPGSMRAAASRNAAMRASSTANRASASRNVV